MGRVCNATVGEIKMKMYKIKIKSASPMLHHGSQSVGMEKVELKKKGGTALLGDSEEWKKTIYFDEKVGVHLPASVFEACLINAGKQFKVTGRKTATEYIKSGVFCMEECLPFLVDGSPIKTLDDERIIIDKRTTKNPSTRGRNMRYRARFDKWSSEFTIMVNSDDYITSDLLKEIIKYAGMFVGVGDYRPRFGRFMLDNFKEVSA